MSEGGRILITGATGNTGLELIQCLRKKNVPLIAGLRNPVKDSTLIKVPIQTILLDFDKAETFKAALNGIDKVYLVRPPAISNVKKFIYPFIDACREAGIKHIVFLSLMGVESNPVTPHYKIEKYILRSGIPYTFIRPSFFMQNLSTTHREDIRNHNEIFVPAGKGKTSFIDVRDISEISALVLTHAGHMNKAYELSGSEALDYYQAAELFTKVLGRKIVYTNPSILSFFLRMRKKKTPLAFILVMIALYTVTKLGLAKKVTFEVKRLLGRDPISFEQFISDNKSFWI